MLDTIKHIYQKLLFPVLLLLIAHIGKSQGNYFYNNGFYEPSWVLDASLNIGGMNSITDIGGNKKSDGSLGATTLRNTHLAGGITLTATHKDWLALRLDIGRGRVEAHDSSLKGSTYFSSIGRFERNLGFRSPVTELFFGVELHPLFFRDYLTSDRQMPRLSPYVMAGLGVMAFKPQANIDDRWVDLRPLRLEGQGFAEYPDRQMYSTTAAIVPMGIGLRYEASQSLTLRGEIIRRTTNTDYLDDVSHGDWVDPTLFFNYLPFDQAVLATRLYNRSILINPPRNTRPRGNTADRDMYWSFQIRAALTLNRESRYGGGGGRAADRRIKRSLRCAF